MTLAEIGFLVGFVGIIVWAMTSLHYIRKYEPIITDLQVRNAKAENTIIRLRDEK